MTQSGHRGSLRIWRNKLTIGKLRATKRIKEAQQTTKPNPSKDGDGKPRVLASSEAFDATKDPKIAGLPPIRLEKKHAIFDVFDWFPVLGCL